MRLFARRLAIFLVDPNVVLEFVDRPVISFDLIRFVSGQLLLFAFVQVVFGFGRQHFPFVNGSSLEPLLAQGSYAKWARPGLSNDWQSLLRHGADVIASRVELATFLVFQ